ncbi:hypothetical protein MMC13_003479 [Lambiella insularis]|nr:hypothetical protein [Lambiella insularis]
MALTERQLTLELLRSDPAANAPELDFDAFAPESTPIPLGLQVAYGDRPELAFDKTAPEVRAVGLEKEVTTEETSFKTKKRLRRSLWAVIAVVLLCSVGIGTGVGLRSRASTTSSNSSTPAPSPPVFNTTSPKSTIAAWNTSLASVTMVNGDRRLFFQDSSKLIKQSIYTFATS